jgi:hypothetical protein
MNKAFQKTTKEDSEVLEVLRGSGMFLRSKPCDSGAQGVLVGTRRQIRCPLKRAVLRDSRGGKGPKGETVSGGKVATTIIGRGVTG